MENIKLEAFNVDKPDEVVGATISEPLESTSINAFTAPAGWILKIKNESTK